MTERVHDVVVVIAAPAAAVWDLLVDVERWPSWTASMKEVSLVGPGPLEVGSAVRIRQPGLPVTTWTVEQLSPGRSFSWSSRRPGVRTVADHRVEAVPEGCRVTLELRQSGPLAGPTGLLFGRVVRRYVRLEAEGLRSRAESPRV